MAAINSDAALDAYVQDMIDNHTRLIEVTVCSHEDEWEATKHAYPAAAFKLLQAARIETGWSAENLVSDQSKLPEPLLDETGTFSAESSECSVCFEPLLIRPSVQGPFTVEFSLQVIHPHSISAFDADLTPPAAILRSRPPFPSRRRQQLHRKPFRHPARLWPARAIMQRQQVT
jgi:hypothetical protein